LIHLIGFGFWTLKIRNQGVFRSRWYGFKLVRIKGWAKSIKFKIELSWPKPKDLLSQPNSKVESSWPKPKST